MPRVLITCPVTGREVYTGLRLNWFTFESFRFGRQELNCPACGETHEWTRNDATLGEDGGDG